MSEAKAEKKYLNLMFASTSHELRTPLNAISSGIEFMLMNSNRSKTEEKTLSMMKSSVSLLLSLINDILDLAKLENEKFELDNAKLSLKALLDKVKQLFVLQAEGKGLKLTVDIDPSATDIEVVSDE